MDNLDLNDLTAIRVLGRGAMGTVFLVVSKSSSHSPPFALKVIHKSSPTQKQDSLRRAHWELSVLSNLSSQNPFLPAFLGSQETPSFLAYAFPFCPGGDLNTLRYSLSDRVFSSSAIRFYLSELLMALSHLHSLHIVYRDLKPENVLVESNGHIVLTDFDLSKRLQHNQIARFSQSPPPAPTKRRNATGAALLNAAKANIKFLTKAKSARVSPVSRRSGRTCGNGFERSNSFVGTEEYVAPEILKGDGHDFAVDFWALAENTTAYLVAVVGERDAKPIAEALRKRASPGAQDEVEFEPDEEEGEDLCNCTFNLAYGAKILLNQTHLRLKRGQRYGLLGPNGSGKSTLMRAINNEQVEGFPKKDEVKTVFVEHDLDAADTELTVLGWTEMKLKSVSINIPTDEIKAKLLEFGFMESQFDAPITSLSGGWRMKLALARAVFEAPDILLLDEPTNHLDVKNVKWLEDYLIASPCTSIIVSHDSKFLDHVIQHVIHYERFKLRRYRGNLSSFVSRVPSAKSYYELGASEMEFKFPEPGFLEGVKTKAKAILRSKDMTFQYPGTTKPQISNITFQVSLGSRIAVIGPNGAGKSTLVNVLTGELIPTSGEIYQHENIRIAYIKQHAFAHIDNHLDKTPSEYIQWRYQTGEDRETMDRANKQITDEDEQSMQKIYKIEGTSRRVIGVNARRKFKNSYEYEISWSLGENIGQKNERWTPMMTADNTWVARSEIVASHAKLVAEVDQKEALASGQFRPLVRKEIEAHCSMFGLDAELVSHSRMRGLSGGQRVKVCLAASSWLRPHLIVLDEPTNYLDRDSLGALSKALKSFEGGVIIISHNAEFTESLTEEVWAVLDGKMTPSGHNWVQGQGSGPRLEQKGDEEEKFDAMGNKIESAKTKKKLTSNEARKKKKERMARRKRGEEVFSDEDD